jgi:hypothetical protein
MIDNGVRPLVIRADGDLGVAWQLNRREDDPRFLAMANLLVTLSDRGQLKPRGGNDWPAEPDGTPVARIVRLRFNGADSPEPLALGRFIGQLAERDGVCVEQCPPVDIKALAGGQADLAVLSGAEPILLNEAQGTALKRFVQKGGCLLIEAAGGSKAFYESMRKQLNTLFAPHELAALPADHAIYTRPDGPVTTVLWRSRSRQRNLPDQPRLEGIEIDARPAVLLSGEDLLAGLLEVEGLTIDGYRPVSAYALCRNILLEVTDVKAPGKPKPRPARRDKPAVAKDRSRRKSRPKPLPTSKAARPAAIGWQAAGEHVGQRCTVEGQIVEANYNRNRTICFLRFSDKPDGFVGVIFQEHFEAFGGNPAGRYEGRRVRLGGEVSRFRDTPQMILRSPDQVELLD